MIGPCIKIFNFYVVASRNCFPNQQKGTELARFDLDPRREMMKKNKLIYRKNLFCFIFVFCIVLIVIAKRRTEIIIEYEENVQIRESRKASSKEKSRIDCEDEKRNVIFVKTHKTASSSVQNVLLR